MGECLYIGEEQAEIFLKHRPGDLFVGLSSGAALENKDQDAV